MDAGLAWMPAAYSVPGTVASNPCPKVQSIGEASVTCPLMLQTDRHVLTSCVLLGPDFKGDRETSCLWLRSRPTLCRPHAPDLSWTLHVPSFESVA